MNAINFMTQPESVQTNIIDLEDLVLILLGNPSIPLSLLLSLLEENERTGFLPVEKV